MNCQGILDSSFSFKKDMKHKRETFKDFVERTGLRLSDIICSHAFFEKTSFHGKKIFKKKSKREQRRIKKYNMYLTHFVISRCGLKRIWDYLLLAGTNVYGEDKGWIHVDTIGGAFVCLIVDRELYYKLPIE